MNGHNKKNRINRKPKKGAAVITSVILALFVVLAVVVATVLLYKPSYEDDFVLTDDSGNNVVVTDPSGEEVEPVRDQEKINVLILGKDRWAFNTDVMIIASYNVTDGSISMMQIPRDTYIDIGRGNLKANSLLASFYNDALRNKESDPMAAAIKGMEEAFEQVFCITIDYYAMLDLNGFVNIVDALGGVEVDVPFNMKYSDPVQGLYINLKKGLQTLDGDEAEQFIRFRADYVEGDIGRVDAQKIFISACISKIKNSFNVTTIANIAKEVIEYVKTDVPLQDLVYYAKNALSVDLDNMTMMTIPGIQGRQYDTSGIWYYFVYRDGMIAAINKYFNTYNFEITTEMFDRDGALYDTEGSYMHSVYLTEYKEEESYTANNTEDITIHKYYYSTTTTTKATTAETTEPIPDEPVVSTGETYETTEPLYTDEIVESGIHTETLEPEETVDPEDTTDVHSETTEVPFETTEVHVEPDETFEAVETTGLPEETEAPEETSAPEETTVVTVTEEPTEPENNDEE